MEKMGCMICGYIYDPEVGDADNSIAKGLLFEDLPEDWICPDCGAGKDSFELEL
jgi:rubredoxin